MSKLSEPMIRALRAIADVPGTRVRPQTMDALRARYLIGMTDDGPAITPSGRAALDGIERAERKRALDERLSRPVPASAFVEPSARTAPVLGHEYEDEPDEIANLEGAPEIKAERVDGVEFAPTAELEIRAGDAVPQAWIDQLVTLLDADARIVTTAYGWRLTSSPVPFQLHPDRVHEAAREAIRRGIARALPPTPGKGVVRLALVPKD